MRFRFFSFLFLTAILNASILIAVVQHRGWGGCRQYSTSGNGINDIDDQAANNYQYYATGNMISDMKEGINGITWNVYGKITGIAKSSGTISYTYDAAGNRISKTSGNITTVYVRDAQGNVMGVYSRDGSNALVKVETHLYGSRRLGIVGQEATARQRYPDWQPLITMAPPGRSSLRGARRRMS